MKRDRLEQLLEQIQQVRILVMGDFFLDQYWVTEPRLAERSVETGKTAHQVVELRTSPGAAGTVVNNLAALGAKSIHCIGLIGEDGTGYQLLHHLRSLGVITEGLLQRTDRNTPSYVKPMQRTADGEEEQERFDIKNRNPLSSKDEEDLFESFAAALDDVDGVALLDQVEEEHCGVLSGTVLDQICLSARRQPEKPFLADSRSRIHLFRNVHVKPNFTEASRATRERRIDPILSTLQAVCRKTVFLTRGAKGVSLFDGRQRLDLPAIVREDPVDIVGAGDTFSAALITSLAAGAGAQEAAGLATLASAITVKKIGTTGTASPEEILQLAKSLSE